MRSTLAMLSPLAVAVALGLSACSGGGDAPSSSTQPSAPPKVSSTTDEGDATGAEGEAEAAKSPAGEKTSADSEPSQVTVTETVPSQDAASPSKETGSSSKEAEGVAKPSTAKSPSGSPQVTEEPEESGTEDCATMTGAQALAQNIGKLRGEGWRADQSDVSGYDPCADLSHIRVSTEEKMAADHQIMLFHRGKYIGTTLYQSTYYMPEIHARRDGSGIDVMYRYAKDGEPLFEPTGETLVSFSWDDTAQKVVMEGELPPEMQ